MNIKNLASTLLIAVIVGSVSGYVTASTVVDDAPGATSTKTVVVEDSSYTAAIDKVMPSVVSVIASKEFEQYMNQPFDPFGGGSPFRFEQRQPTGDSELREIGGGTGFIVSEDGYVLTNKHVVSDPTVEYTAIATDGTKYYAEVLSVDPANDLAVLQIYENVERTKEASGLTPVELGDSDALRVGSHVIAIGNALSEFENTITAGILSGKGRQIVAGSPTGADQSTLSGLFQTDAAINPGNSGGPLVNIAGQVIGVNTAVAAQASGIGFAIPINDVKNVIDSVKEHGRIIRPYLGIRYTEVNEQLAEQLGLQRDNGAYLADDIASGEASVLPGSPADKAGLRPGDLIVTINGNSIDEDSSLQSLVRDFRPGDTVTLGVVRGSTELEIKVKLAEFET